MTPLLVWQPYPDGMHVLYSAEVGCRTFAPPLGAVVSPLGEGYHWAVWPHAGPMISGAADTVDEAKREAGRVIAGLIAEGVTGG